MLKLRPNQEEPVRKAIEYFRKENPAPAIMVCPTGWGKSILAAEVAAACPDPILVVQPSKELLEQNLRKYRLLCGDLAPAGIYSASFRKKQIDHVTFATIGSIQKIGSQFRELGFKKMLIDEAHLYPRKEQSMLGQFLRDSGIRQVLGITATPLKLEQMKEKQEKRFDSWSVLTMLTSLSPDGTFFKEILHVSQVQEMVNLGFWSPLKYEVLPFNRSALKMNTIGSEFTADSEVDSYVLNNIRENIFAALDYHTDRKHCLVFVPSVEEAQALAEIYPESAYLSGETPKAERTKIIEDYTSGRIRVLFNCAILITGFDYPKIDLIILASSTASVSRYFQEVGRGVRIDPDKKDCVIIDMAGNYERFGRAEDAMYKLGHDGRWRLYGTEGRLLSGVPVTILGQMTRLDVCRAYTRPWDDPKLNYGKYKGKRISEIPMGYRIWLLKNSKDATEKDYVFRAIENHVRDTRNDPPMKTLPDGTHSGKPMEQIPNGYLRWYYKSKTWNETNDSLRRGIEKALNRWKAGEI